LKFNQDPELLVLGFQASDLARIPLPGGLFVEALFSDQV
jgi:hypothetical protein